MTAFRLEARHLVERTAPARFAGLYVLLSELVTLLPSFKDTRKGRQFAQTLRMMFVIVGVLWFATATGELRLVGVAIAALALVLPVPEMRRRTLVAKLKRRAQVTTLVSEPVEVVWDGKRLDVVAGERIRRVLTRAGGFEVVGEGDEVTIRSKAGRKSETIVLARDPGVDKFSASATHVDELVRGLREAL